MPPIQLTAPNGAVDAAVCARFTCTSPSRATPFPAAGIDGGGRQGFASSSSRSCRLGRGRIA